MSRNKIKRNKIDADYLKLEICLPIRKIIFLRKRIFGFLSNFLETDYFAGCNRFTYTHTLHTYKQTSTEAKKKIVANQPTACKPARLKLNSSHNVFIIIVSREMNNNIY